MHTRRVAVPFALIVCLLLVPAAAARLPTPGVKTVIPGKAVAGVKLGMTLPAAKQKWGAGSKCGPGTVGPGSIQCTWRSTNNARSPKLTLLSVGGKIRAIVVDGGTGGAAIRSFRTPKGIGIGSTRAALRAAYSGLGTPLGPNNPSLGSGATITSFYVQGGKIKSLQVGSPS